MENLRNKKIAFTLAEVLITLTILGIVAAITVPSLVRKQTESSNRVKIKKSMAAYEEALNKMVLLNGINSNAALVGLNGDNCAKTTDYFKKTAGEGCTFKTADGIWWNIENIQQVLVSTKEINNSKADYTLAKAKNRAENLSDMTAFYFFASIDSNGSLRINDLSYETTHIKGGTAYNDYYMYKLYAYIKNDKESINKLPCIAKGWGVRCDYSTDSKTIVYRPGYTEYIYDSTTKKMVGYKNYYSSSGTIKQEREYYDGYPDGVTGSNSGLIKTLTEYYETGEKSRETIASNQGLNQTYTTYDKSGKITRYIEQKAKKDNATSFLSTKDVIYASPGVVGHTWEYEYNDNDKRTVRYCTHYDRSKSPDLVVTSVDKVNYEADGTTVKSSCSASSKEDLGC